MGKSRAGRREQRHAKRDVARATRDTKYANQKGGGIGKKGRKLRAPGGDDDDAPMAVIRDGKAVYVGAEKPLHTEPAAAEAPPDEAHAANERFTSAQKKARALRKKLRRVSELKARRRRGEELDSAQQALLREEPTLKQELAHFESVQDDDDQGDPVEEEPLEEVTGSAGPAADDETGDVDEAPAGSRLEQRRALKRKRHLDRVKQRQERKSA